MKDSQFTVHSSRSLAVGRKKNGGRGRRDYLSPLLRFL